MKDNREIQTINGGTYLVTGVGNGNLGAAVINGLVERGANVISIGRKDVNFSDILDVKARAFESRIIDDFGVPVVFDGVVHCAGSERIKALNTISPGDWEEISACVTSAIGLLGACSSGLFLRAGGSVVLVSSASAIKGTSGLCAYAAAKGAIEALTRSAAVELARRRVRVNCVAPGGFTGPMHDRVMRVMDEDGANKYRDKHPLGFGTPQDVASAILYLLGPESRWVTGAVLRVDGGITAC